MPPYCEKHQIYYVYDYSEFLPWKTCFCEQCRMERTSAFNPLPQAIKATESPSVAAADKGLILTEEELQALSEIANEFRGLRISNVMNLINSHRQLLSANAELSFSNMLLKAAYDKLLKETKSCSTH